MSAFGEYAVLLRGKDQPAAEAVRRAFRSFQHLTDADAVRLAANAQGILMRHLKIDEAKALQHALVTQGIDAAIVNERDLQLLPPSRVLNRIDLMTEDLLITDYVGRPTAVPWERITMVALAAVPHVEISTTHLQSAGVRFHPVFGLWPKKTVETRSHLETKPHLILELVVGAREARYEVLGHQFPFQETSQSPAGSLADRFVCLSREIIGRATQAILNRAAEDIRDGVPLVRGYPSRQAFQDEMIWLLWKQMPVRY